MLQNVEVFALITIKSNIILVFSLQLAFLITVPSFNYLLHLLLVSQDWTECLVSTSLPNFFWSLSCSDIGKYHGTVNNYKQVVLSSCKQATMRIRI